MHRGTAPTLIVVALALASCSQATSLLPGALRCGGTDAQLCGRVANLAIAQMNLTATGPITRVTLESWDCGELGLAEFHATWAEAEACWRAVVTGERSQGWSFVVLWPNGDLEPST